MQTIVTVATLLLLLAALLVVNKARKEAAEERESARTEAAAIRDEARAFQADVQRREERLALQERQLADDQRNAQAYARGLDDRVAAIARDEKQLLARQEDLEAEYVEKLASLAEMSVDEAREALLARVRAEAEASIAQDAHRLAKKVQREAEAMARETLVEAMQRQAGASTTQSATTRIALPSEEMKGRIIGREGRNIRAFEALTGVNVIVDEGDNAVYLSSFDVERREIAEVTLHALIADGRIQPHRVESAYEKARADAPARAMTAAREAVEQAGVDAVPAPLLELLGALRLRTSYNQNVLAHLVECAQIAGNIATQIGADVAVARRGAFLHDIGKALTGTREGTHAALGAQVARDVGESELVVNAIAAHHDEVPQESLEAVIVQIADAISASRPGARRDDSDTYVERMEALERLVAEHEGVDHVYAMAQGRELRVVVQPDKVDDDGTAALARTLAEHIEKDFGFAGEIRVTVIRETRANSVAGQA